MADLLKNIRKIIEDHLNYLVMGNTITGKITKMNPLEITIDANITLTEEFLQVDIPLPPAALHQSVTLQRAEGGQKYYVLEKQYWK